MRTIEEVGQDVLAVIREQIDPHAVIAGGWARDSLLTRTPKDVDVWYHTDGLQFEALLEALRAAFPDIVYKSTLVSETASPAAVWCQAISKFTLDGHDIDFVLFVEPIQDMAVNVLAQFDFGICQAAFDGKEFITTTAFDADVQQQTLTFQDEAREREDLPRVLYDHLSRLQAKFPDFQPRNLPDLSDAPKVASGLRPLAIGGGSIPFGY